MVARMSTVLLTLDTHPPVLAIDSPSRLRAGEVWVVTLTANEMIGVPDLRVIDALGVSHEIGVSVVGNVVTVTIPTISLATGDAALVGNVPDVVGNPSLVHVSVVIDRDRAYSADLLFERGYDAALFMDRGYEVFLDMERGG